MNEVDVKFQPELFAKLGLAVFVGLDCYPQVCVPNMGYRFTEGDNAAVSE